MPFDAAFHRNKLSREDIARVDNGEAVVISADELKRLKARIDYLERRVVELKGRIND